MSSSEVSVSFPSVVLGVAPLQARMGTTSDENVAKYYKCCLVPNQNESSRLSGIKRPLKSGCGFFRASVKGYLSSLSLLANSGIQLDNNSRDTTSFFFKFKIIVSNVDRMPSLKKPH